MIRYAFALVGSALLLSGCLTIEENYTFKKNGSGSMEYVVDMSELADLMKSLKGLSDGKKDEGDLGNMDLTGEVAGLKKVPGISKVSVKKERDGYVQRLSFRFKDLQALNGALNVIIPDSTGQQHTFFQWRGDTLVRTNNHHATELGAGVTEDEGGDNDTKALLESLKYNYSFTFAQPIVDITTADGVTRETPGPKQVKMNTDWTVIMSDPKALDLRIALKR